MLTRSAIRPEELIAAVSAPDRGGLALFLGVVRDHHDGRPVRELEYSAYEPMAETVAAALVSEAEARWPVMAAIRHRLGTLAVGETAVVIAVSGGHRDEAFAACRFLIEELKARVPIWKLERYADGSADWVASPEPSAKSQG